MQGHYCPINWVGAKRAGRRGVILILSTNHPTLATKILHLSWPLGLPFLNYGLSFSASFSLLAHLHYALGLHLMVLYQLSHCFNLQFMFRCKPLNCSEIFGPSIHICSCNVEYFTIGILQPQLLLLIAI